MNLELARQLYMDAKQLAGLASEELLESYSLEKQRAEICMRDVQTGEIIPIAELTAACTYDDRLLMMKSPALIRALLFLLDRSFSEIRRLQPKPDRQKDFAAECAMKCQTDGMFKRYLMEAHELVDAGDAERIKTRVRSILGIASMAELNKDPGAGARWRRLRGDFDAWRRGI